MQAHPAALQEVELGAHAPLVQGPVGAVHPGAAGLDDQRQGRHAAAADAAKEIGCVASHRRKLWVRGSPWQATGMAWICMSRETVRIGVVAPGSTFDPDVADEIQVLAASLYPAGA